MIRILTCFVACSPSLLFSRCLRAVGCRDYGCEATGLVMKSAIIATVHRNRQSSGKIRYFGLFVSGGDSCFANCCEILIGKHGLLRVRRIETLGHRRFPKDTAFFSLCCPITNLDSGVGTMCTAGDRPALANLAAYVQSVATAGSSRNLANLRGYDLRAQP